MATVLVVDDIQPLRRLLRLALGQQHDVHEAADGREAIELLQRFRPDVVILDVDMPVLDGLEVCRRLRADPNIRDIAVIIVSANSVASDAQQAGADRFLAKPYRLSVLSATIDDLTRRRTVA